MLYTIETVGEKGVTLQGGAALTFSQVVQMLRLAHAMTYASVQSRETGGSLCLHNTDRPHFSSKHLYVGLSRAKTAAAVRVE